MQIPFYFELVQLLVLWCGLISLLLVAVLLYSRLGAHVHFVNLSCKCWKSMYVFWTHNIMEFAFKQLFIWKLPNNCAYINNLCILKLPNNCSYINIFHTTWHGKLQETDLSYTKHFDFPKCPTNGHKKHHPSLLSSIP